MDKTGLIGEVLEQGGQVIKPIVKAVKGAPASALKTAVSQVAPPLAAPTSSDASDEGIEKVAQPSPNDPIFPKLHGLTNKHNELKPETIAKKDGEKNAKLSQVRQELHGMYYQKLVQRPKREERASEKVEREDQEEEQKDMIKAHEEKKKELPNSVRQGTGEKLTGIGG